MPDRNRRPLASLLGGLRGGRSQSDRIAPQETIGAPGYSIYGGYLQREEKSQQLETTRERYRLFANFLANTLIVAAGVRYFLDLVAKAEWKAEPSDPDNPQAVEMAEFVESVMSDMNTPWRRVVRRAAMYKFYGFSIQEWTAKRRDEDGQLGFLDVEPRAHYTIERWDTDRVGNILGVIQCTPQTSEELYIPRGKIVYMVDDSLTDSPEGLGLFRHMVDEVRRLKRYEELEGYGYETDLRGVPVGFAPLNELNEKLKTKKATQKDINLFLEPIRQFIKSHIKGESNGVVLDSEPFRDRGEDSDPSSTRKYGVELLDAGQMGHDSMNNAIIRTTRMIAILLGVEELLIGSDGSGSMALSKNKTNKLFFLVHSTMRELEETFQKDLVDRLWSLNGFNDELKPKLKSEDVQFKDIVEIAGALSDMASAGVPINRRDEVVREFFSVMGLTPPDPDDEFDMQDATLPREQNQGTGGNNSDNEAEANVNRDTEAV